jgi:hypothetical protein
LTGKGTPAWECSSHENVSEKVEAQRATPEFADGDHRAVRSESDGQVLINISQCEGRDVAGREVFLGVPISEEEAHLARHAVDNAVFDVAARVAGTMRETKPASKAGSKAKALERRIKLLPRGGHCRLGWPS